MSDKQNEIMNAFSKLRGVVTGKIEKKLKNIPLPSKKILEEKFKDITKNYETEIQNLKKKYEKDLHSLKKLAEDIILDGVAHLIGSKSNTAAKRQASSHKRNSTSTKTQKITSRESK